MPQLEEENRMSTEDHAETAASVQSHTISSKLMAFACIGI
jgi:hypothetical protein